MDCIVSKFNRTNADKTSWDSSVEISVLMTTRAWSPNTIVATRARSSKTVVAPARLRGPKRPRQRYSKPTMRHHHFPIAHQNSPNHLPPESTRNPDRRWETRTDKLDKNYAIPTMEQCIRMIHMLTRHLLDHHTSFKIVFANSALSQLGTQQPVTHRHAWEILDGRLGLVRGAIAVGGRSWSIAGSAARAQAR